MWFSARPVSTSASNPSEPSSRAEPTSHGFGMTKRRSRAWSSRNRVRRSPTDMSAVDQKLLRSQKQLGAAEERQLPAVGCGQDGVPELRRPAAVDESCLARERPFPRRAQEVRLQLDRREARGALRQAEDAAVAAG